LALTVTSTTGAAEARTAAGIVFGIVMSSKPILEERPLRRLAATTVLLSTALAAFAVGTPAGGHDNGQFTNVSPAVQNWFHNVRSPSGVPCCDIADGHRTEFQMRKNEYWVPINGTWMPVPPQAVVSNSGNPVGDAVVWYSIYGGRVMIRCFVPGSAT
jgi:hypothetical protein